jgi:hypothetical protein
MQERVLGLGSQTPLPKLIPLGYLLVIASLIAFGAARELLSDRKAIRENNLQRQG